HRPGCRVAPRREQDRHPRRRDARRDNERNACCSRACVKMPKLKYQALGTSASTTSTHYPASLRPIFRTAINATPIKKLVSTSLLPCLSISPTTACVARYRNPPPTCAMIKPSQKVETLPSHSIPIAPPRSVVASTAATQASAVERRSPAPIKRLPSARPSGTL